MRGPADSQAWPCETRRVSNPCRLSIIIPAIDEAASLPLLLGDLQAQQGGVDFEILVVDGGSRDDTVAACQRCAQRTGAALRVFQTRPGRGHQLNCGVSQAVGPVLLFLHADSRLPSSSWLHDSLMGVEQALAQTPSRRVAAHHPLRFGPDNGGAALAYFYAAAKSALNLPESMNGDQGLWIAKEYLLELDGFDESLPYMEDARLARKIGATGHWLTLPDVLETSPRRFESQGLAARQWVNALLRWFDAAECPAFFVLARNAYEQQSGAGSLQVLPILAAAQRAVWQSGLRSGVRQAWRLGKVAARQSWQLFFLIDVLGARRRHVSAQSVPAHWVARYQRWLSPAMRTKPVTFGAAVAAVVFLGASWLAARVARLFGINTKEGNDTSRGVHTRDRNTKEGTAHK